MSGTRWRERFPERTFVQVGGFDLHYERKGKGRPVLLVHGLGDSTLTWRGSARLLAKAGFDVIAIDLRGSGYSEKPVGADMSTHALVEELANAIDLLNLERPAIAGVSYGGLLALLLAARHPGKVSALIICNALAYPEPVNLPLDLRLARNPMLNAVGHWVMSRRGLEKTFRLWNYNDGWDGLTTRVDEHWKQLNLPNGRRAFMALVRGFDQSVVERAALLYPMIRVPTLLLWGEREKWFPKEQGEKLKRAIHKSKLVIVKKGMHLFMEEDPALFAKHAVPFLKRALKKLAERKKRNVRRTVRRVVRRAARTVKRSAKASRKR